MQNEEAPNVESVTLGAFNVLILDCLFLTNLYIIKKKQPERARGKEENYEISDFRKYHAGGADTF